MSEGAPQIVEICTTGADSVRHCIEQTSGLLIWGSTTGMGGIEAGLGLVLGAYFAGFAMACLKRVFFEER